MWKSLVALTLILLGAPYIYVIFLKSVPSLPDIDLNEWWGPEQLKTKEDTDISVRPFRVEFSQVMIEDLKARLKAHRSFVPKSEGLEHGLMNKQLHNLIKYWAEDYPFSEREEAFNNYPQFKTNIQGLDIHFIRIKPEVPADVETLPLLLVHGWPGSVREFDAAIPLLTAVSKDRDFALDVVIPSLPGFGFSDTAVRPGLGADKVAVVFKNLMNRLGFKKYYIQGEDWVGIITTTMATMFPEEILGYHANTAFSFSPEISLFNVTVGVALSDSPSGLLAYILEKFSSWVTLENRYQTHDSLGTRFTMEQLIDNLMMYWTPNTITTSMQLYSETFSKRYHNLRLDEIPTPVPTWIIKSKDELSYFPDWMMRMKFKNLIEETILDEQGHFIAMQLPKIFSEDVLKAITTFRKWHEQNTLQTEL